MVGCMATALAAPAAAVAFDVAGQAGRRHGVGFVATFYSRSF